MRRNEMDHYEAVAATEEYHLITIKKLKEVIKREMPFLNKKALESIIEK